MNNYLIETIEQLNKYLNSIKVDSDFKDDII